MVNKTKVLIVEDDPNSASFLHNQLVTLGYSNIDFAVSAADAVKLAGEKKPDVIFLDIFLRDKMNGIHAAREILKVAEIPIIFTTAASNYYLLNEAGFAEQPNLLSKPFTISDIRESLKHLNNEKLNLTPEFKEAERLQVLHSFSIVNTPREKSFDTIARTAAKIFRVSAAAVTLVDRDKIWFKSKYGFRKNSIPKKPELFAQKFLPDKFHDSNESVNGCELNPLFARENGFVFYACAPLLTDEGHSLGTLCVMDQKPRQISGDEREILSNLASLVMLEMEMRRETTNSERRHREFVSTAVHNLKNPLTSVLGFSDILAKRLKEEESEFNGYIRQSATSMLAIVNNLLETTLLELEQIRLKRIPIRLAEIVESGIAMNRGQAFRKRQDLVADIGGNAVVDVDPVRMSEVVDNLISNAIKFSPNASPIYVSVKEVNKVVRFSVTDKGPGITSEKINTIFHKFSSQDATPTGGESSTGLGLAISKTLTELHGGKISASSEGAGKGSTFTVELPAIGLSVLEAYERSHESSSLT